MRIGGWEVWLRWRVLGGGAFLMARGEGEGGLRVLLWWGLMAGLLSAVLVVGGEMLWGLAAGKRETGRW